MWSPSCHKAFWSSSAETERRIQGASGSWYLYCSCTVAVTADMSIFVSVFLHWRAMTGTVVQLSSWVLRCDWLAVTGHGGSCHRRRCTGTSACALFCGKGHKGITPQTSQLLDFSLQHSAWAWHVLTLPSPVVFGYNNPLLIHRGEWHNVKAGPECWNWIYLPMTPRGNSLHVPIYSNRNSL